MTSNHQRFGMGQGLMIGLLMLLRLSGCAAAPTPKDPGAEFATAAPQPANVGDGKIAALAYHDSGAYDRDLAFVAAQARAWIASRASAVKQPAVVFDVDETALSNWEVLKRDDFGRPVPGPCDAALDTPCGWAAWDQLGRDPAIKSTLDVFQQARALNIPVFFITGRPESQRAATERDLAAVGYSGYAKLYLLPDRAHFASAADFKAPVRSEIEQSGYTIIANIGDQPSDLIGDHAERKFLLPDPFYRVP